MKSLLARKTLDLVSSRPKGCSLRKIAHATGVPLDWLRAFTYNKIEPERANVAYLEAVYGYMTGKPFAL